MLRFLFTRIALIIVSLLVVSLAIFAVTEVLPGDVANMILGQGATPQDLTNIRRDLGLDRPAPVRYLDWITNAVRGDLGDSYVQRRPIVEVVTDRLKNSAILAVFAFLFSVPPAVLTGIVLGTRKDKLLDQTVSLASLVGISMPEFVTGVVLIVIFATTFGILPSSSIMLPGTSPLTTPKILVLPTLTLTGAFFAYVMRMTRANVIDVMETNYVRTAILAGLPMRTVVLRHVVPNAMLPTISIIALTVGWMLGGLIIVESVFAYPGIGSLVLTSITTRDVPLLQALALLMAVAYGVSNLLADITYALLNPRIRLGS